MEIIMFTLFSMFIVALFTSEINIEEFKNYS